MQKIKNYSLFLLLLSSISVLAQTPQVPEKMKFADMELTISPAARKKIQTSVDALMRSPTHFQIKVDRAHLYFPYIEKAFEAENLPQDFKYLVLQESGLVSDAISSSNAIGFWQFKIPAASEAGLTIDDIMDERKHIIRSSHGSAKYLKQNNLFFGNWIYALQAYNTGAGGAKKESDPQWYGKKKMDIDANTHWYVLKFIAHKVAFDDAFRKIDTQPLALLEYQCSGETMKSIAQKFNVELEELEKFNKCLNVSTVPNDRKYYSVMVPVAKENLLIAQEKATDEITKINIKENVEEDKKEIHAIAKAEELPAWFVKKKKQETSPDNPHIIVKINGLVVIKAKEGDTKDILAINGGIGTKDFLKYNDIKSFYKIKTGEFYYLERKNKTHFSRYHVVMPNETIWGIAQHYGIQLKALLKKNRMKPYEALNYGRQLYLKDTRPKDEPVKYVKVELPEKQKSKPEPVREIPKAEEIIKRLPQKDSTIINTSQLLQEVKKELENEQEKHKTLMYHVVQQGESLYGISKKYNTTPDQILQWNDMQTNTISIDQKIIVGWKEDLMPLQENYRTHIVKQGETLFSISKQYEISIPELLEWNKKTKETLFVGEELRILKK